VDLECLNDTFRQEQREYYLQTAQVGLMEGMGFRGCLGGKARTSTPAGKRS
jgi:hypothetical protein